MSVKNSRDQVYCSMDFSKLELEHAYGKNIHIVTDPVSLGQLAELSQACTIQPKINNLVRELYQFLVRYVVRKEFPTQEISIKTRMAEFSDRGVWSGRVIKKNTKTITVNVMRAGALPSQVSFDFLNRILDPQAVRQDHLVMSRLTDKEEKVIGAELFGSKIGGDVEQAIVLFPDPMGATGSSLSQAISYYEQNILGNPDKIICLNLIITPEYIQKITQDHPEVKIYALRLDRGASDSEILTQSLGKNLQQESGLDQRQYILPGAGGLGELINNSFC